MGKAQRDKGRRGELLWRDVCREHGFAAERGGQYYQRGCEVADVVGLPGIHIECKFCERLNVRQAMEQSKRDAVGDELPILAHKTSRKEWLVTMRATDWFLLYRLWALANC